MKLNFPPTCWRFDQRFIIMRGDPCVKPRQQFLINLKKKKEIRNMVVLIYEKSCSVVHNSSVSLLVFLFSHEINANFWSTGSWSSFANANIINYWYFIVSSESQLHIPPWTDSKLQTRSRSSEQNVWTYSKHH